MSDRQRLEDLRKRKRLAELREIKAQADTAPQLAPKAEAGRFGLRQAASMVPFLGPASRNLPEKQQEQFGAAVLGVGQGATFGFADEALGGREALEQAKADFPKTALAGEIGGSLGLGGLGLAKLGAVKGGALTGGVYGAGTAEGGLEERAKGAAGGAALGAAGGKAVDAAGSGLAALARSKAGQKAAGAIPSLDELRDIKNAAYKAVDDQGVAYSPEQAADLVRGISDQLPLTGPNARTTGPAVDVVKRLGGVKDSITLSQLEDLRGMAFPNKMNATPTELRDSGIVRENVDQFMAGITPETGQNASQLVSGAREKAGRYIRSRELNEALEGATTQAKSNRAPDQLFSQGKAVASILKNKNRRRGFSQTEIEAMQKFVESTGGSSLTSRLAKLSPETGGLTSLLSVGGAASPAAPLTLTANAIGFGAKRASERKAQRNLDDLIRLVRTGGEKPSLDTNLSRALDDQRLQSLLTRAGLVAAL